MMVAIAMHGSDGALRRAEDRRHPRGNPAEAAKKCRQWLPPTIAVCHLFKKGWSPGARLARRRECYVVSLSGPLCNCQKH